MWRLVPLEGDYSRLLDYYSLHWYLDEYLKDYLVEEHLDY